MKKITVLIAFGAFIALTYHSAMTEEPNTRSLFTDCTEEQLDACRAGFPGVAHDAEVLSIQQIETLVEAKCCAKSEAKAQRNCFSKELRSYRPRFKRGVNRAFNSNARDAISGLRSELCGLYSALF